MDDLHLLEKYRVPAGAVAVQDGCWVNFVGLNTRTEWFPSASQYQGQHLSELPVPDDKVYAGTTEYTSLLTAIDERGDDRSTFTAIELGAGWGPWISAAGVVCRRLGFSKIKLVGVEADKTKTLNIGRQLAANGLTESPVEARVIHGAAWSEDTTLFFPKDIPTHDYGGAASVEQTATDYRGMAYQTEEVSAYSLPTICSGLGTIDYAHWDLQGAEWTVAVHARDFLNEHVRYLFIGTHSRRIEGNLLGLFFAMGWDVLRHTPCGYKYDRSKPSLEAMTHTDGELFLANPRLASPGPTTASELR